MTKLRKRPIGLWIIGLVQLVPSILSCFVVSVIVLAIPLQKDPRVIALWGTFVFLWVFSGVSAWISWAFLRLRWWARIAMLLLVVATLLYPITLPVYRAAKGQWLWFSLVPRALYTLWVLWYLRRAPIKALFGPDPLSAKPQVVESAPPATEAT